MTRAKMNDTSDISCGDALKRLFDYLDRELDDHAHGEMERHLHRCRACFSRLEFEKRLKARLRETARDDTPAQLQERIQQLLRKY